MKLKDKVAVVTGAGRNIGEAIAKRLAQEGAKIAVVDLDGARARAYAAIERIEFSGKQFRRDIGQRGTT